MRKSTVNFTAMKDGSREDCELLATLQAPHLEATVDRLLDELRRQGMATLEGYRITRLEHTLHSATRASQDGADIDCIVATLLHDIGDGLAPKKRNFRTRLK